MMKKGYRLLGEFIRQVDVRNTEGKEENLLGVSVQKQFIPSIANTVGTDFTKYKVVRKGQFFINNRGAKVFFDIEKQPIFPINEGSQTAMVLSVGMSNMALPLITVLKDEKPVCYRLPQELSDWAYTVIGIANMGENLFPAQVTFSKINGRYCADIL